MRTKTIILGTLLSVAVLNVSAEDRSHGQDVPGSNSSGKEKLCLLKTSTNEAYAESLAKCNRGDIIPLGMVTAQGIMTLCDFSKAIIYAGTQPVACVYTGSKRPS